jgi:hypothetical protein
VRKKLCLILQKKNLKNDIKGSFDSPFLMRINNLEA